MQEQRSSYIEQQVKRKQDTHKKIMLGALFVKAGLDDFFPHDPAVLYGMLLYSKKLIDQNTDNIVKFRNLGKELIK